MTATPAKVTRPAITQKSGRDEELGWNAMCVFKSQRSRCKSVKGVEFAWRHFDVIHFNIPHFVQIDAAGVCPCLAGGQYCIQITTVHWILRYQNLLFGANTLIVLDKEILVQNLSDFLADTGYGMCIVLNFHENDVIAIVGQIIMVIYGSSEDMVMM